jgi:hypothetical protein
MATADEAPQWANLRHALKRLNAFAWVRDPPPANALPALPLSVRRLAALAFARLFHLLPLQPPRAERWPALAPVVAGSDG